MKAAWLGPLGSIAAYWRWGRLDSISPMLWTSLSNYYRIRIFVNWANRSISEKVQFWRISDLVIFLLKAVFCYFQWKLNKYTDCPVFLIIYVTHYHFDKSASIEELSKFCFRKFCCWKIVDLIPLYNHSLIKLFFWGIFIDKLWIYLHATIGFCS